MDQKPVVQKVIVGGIITNKGHILIVQRSGDEESYPNMWEIPSGKKEPLEDTYEALIREVKEEVGLDVEVIDVVNVFNFKTEKEGEIRDATQINFLTKLKSETEVVLSGEHQSFAWISQEDLNSYNLSEKTRNSINIAFKKFA